MEDKVTVGRVGEGSNAPPPDAQLKVDLVEHGAEQAAHHREEDDCPGVAVWAVECPSRPCKSDVENRFTVENAKGT